MDTIQFSLGNQETGYSFLKAPPGYSVFNKDMYSEIIWIKDLFISRKLSQRY